VLTSCQHSLMLGHFSHLPNQLISHLLNDPNS